MLKSFTVKFWLAVLFGYAVSALYVSVFLGALPLRGLLQLALTLTVVLSVAYAVLSFRSTSWATIFAIFAAAGVYMLLGGYAAFWSSIEFLPAQDDSADIEIIFALFKSVIFVFFVPVFLLWSPPVLASLTSMIAESQRFREWFSFGKGRNARWAGPSSISDTHSDVISETNGARKKSVYIGRSMLIDAPYRSTVFLDDDAHLVTLASSGSGKSTTAIWPNLLMYDGPVIVLDPKGEHAEFSGKRRACDQEGNKKHGWILDPFGKVSGFKSSKYNPLSEIDIKADGVRALISSISEGCILDEGARDPHFPEAAKTMIEGVIAHVLSSMPKDKHNLPFVADLFRGFDEGLGVSDPEAFDNVVAEMSTNSAAGGLPMDAATIYLNAADRERGSIMTTCARSLKWVNDPAMRSLLMESDFTIARHIIYRTVSTLYLVLPFEFMSETSQIRWMRVMINLISTHLFRASRRSDISRVLFVFDEFFRLGYMKMIEENIVTARGAGAKYWILTQDIGQLKSLYKENWETFLGSSNVQAFGVNDLQTCEWIASSLGGQKESKSDQYPLMRPDEVREFLGKDRSTQILIRVDGLPMRLARASHVPIGQHGGLGLAEVVDRPLT